MAASAAVVIPSGGKRGSDGEASRCCLLMTMAWTQQPPQAGNMLFFTQSTESLYTIEGREEKKKGEKREEWFSR